MTRKKKKKKRMKMKKKMEKMIVFNIMFPLLR